MSFLTTGLLFVPAVHAFVFHRKTWGDWVHLDTPREMPRYAALEALRLTHAPDASVLDLGCGTGLVLRSLTTAVPYYGIELQRAAVRQGQSAITDPRAQQIVCGDLADLRRLDGATFGCILFNEVLYYQPTVEAALDVMREYAELLTDDGIFIVSIALDANRPERMNNRVWEAVNTHYADRITDRMVVACEDVPTWHMLVIRP